MPWVPLEYKVQRVLLVPVDSMVSQAFRDFLVALASLEVPEQLVFVELLETLETLEQLEQLE